jgi:hypothetical protein
MDPLTHLLRPSIAAAAAFAAILVSGCATEGTSGAGYYGDTYYYDDPWYYGGCCVDPPGDIGPPAPHPEHPIAKPPPARPAQPIATPSRPTPMPRAAVRGGGRGGRR